MLMTKPIFLAVLAVALAVFALDCGAAVTPERAMQCCDSMPCSAHGHHGQDCCESMPSMHVPFVQPFSVNGISACPLVLAALPAFHEFQISDSSVIVIAAHCHAPPILYAAPTPLRI
jgi:hypothetical protein